MSKKCSQCDAPATLFYNQTNLCSIHYRVQQMRVCAKRWGKAIPSKEHLVELVAQIVAADMRCQVCGCQMNWLKREGHKTVVTLQHDRSGEFRLICFSCNVKHQFHDGDEFYAAPANSKRCPACKLTKDKGDFYLFASTGKSASTCKLCSRQKTLANYWTNREVRVQSMREYKKKRKAELAAANREYRATHKAERAAYMRAFRAKRRAEQCA